MCYLYFSCCKDVFIYFYFIKLWLYGAVKFYQRKITLKLETQIAWRAVETSFKKKLKCLLLVLPASHLY